jgi:hypothetical protein
MLSTLSSVELLQQLDGLDKLLMCILKNETPYKLMAVLCQAVFPQLQILRLADSKVAGILCSDPFVKFWRKYRRVCKTDERERGRAGAPDSAPDGQGKSITDLSAKTYLLLRSKRRSKTERNAK